MFLIKQKHIIFNDVKKGFYTFSLITDVKFRIRGYVINFEIFNIVLSY